MAANSNANAKMASFYPEKYMDISPVYARIVVRTYNSLMQKSKEASKPEDSIQFFTEVVKMLNVSEGNGPTDAELTPKLLKNNICAYLGNTATPELGCKLNETSPKLDTYMKVMMGIIKDYLASIPNKDTFDTDRGVMKAFTKAIRTLVYFYGYKSLPPLLSQDDPFVTFFNEINAIFPAPGSEKKNNEKTNLEKIPRKVIRITCNKKLYECGRFIIDAECEKGRHFVVIDAKDPSSNSGPYPGLDERVSEIASVCGGRRKKTRKQKKARRNQKKKTRSSKHR